MAEAEIRVATPADLERLLPLVTAYHRFEGIHRTDQERRQALLPLLDLESQVGFILLVADNDELVGYLALCFGYTIEFGGRDAFVDELYVAEGERGRGLGSRLLQAAKEQATKLGVNALHLEVARANAAAKTFYSKLGFKGRETFHLMTCDLS